MASLNMIQALNSALDVKMTQDPNVLSFGEDAGYFGGVFRVTDQLQQKHGLTRSFDAPQQVSHDVLRLEAHHKGKITQKTQTIKQE